MDPYAPEIKFQFDSFACNLNKKVEELKEFFLEESSASNSRIAKISARLVLAEKAESQAREELENAKMKIYDMQNELNQKDEIILSLQRLQIISKTSPLRFARSPVSAKPMRPQGPPSPLGQIFRNRKRSRSEDENEKDFSL